MTEAERISGDATEPRGEDEAAPAADGKAVADADTADPAGRASAGDKAAEAGDGASEEAARGPRRIGVLLGVAALVYALDLVTKLIVVAQLEPDNRSVEVVGDLLRFQVVRNAGAAFGIGESMTVIFTLIAVIVIGVIARLARKLYSLPWAIALGLLLGGPLGNLTDRLFRSPGFFEGHVVDFIAPEHFAVFNLADSAIVCGGILIVILSFRGLDPDGTIHRG
ncbi:signal peptidase II [Streptomyces sp. CMB-StM0423]|uniref:signal peptidase II n=1 Tax=Streptomyces sp. CMB-StM0423 TaxID=2059884 RepID=UPI000C6FE00B|nr:signal peptidase II [Streptomyces sp. CMB-StM0423]AUH43521.1 signal peptidase II [Streptomyces sp. CMB-StM0423]